MNYAPTSMHIPDGFLSTIAALVLWAVSAIIVGYSLRRASRELQDRQVPLMGVLAAAVFAGQMLNFSVAGGTSGHLLGATVATILLGPWAAIVVMTSVVSIQALIFQDGGLLALGANLFNISIVGVAVSYFVYTTLRRVAGGRPWSLFAGGFAAAWSSVFIASLACALELAVSGTSPANVSVPAMGSVHALIGVGEGLITVGALTFLFATRPDLLAAKTARASGTPIVWVFGLGTALVLAVLSPLASAHPDGLEWFARQEGFLNAARDPVYSLMSGYLLPGIKNEAAATILAGIIGTLIVLAVVLGMACLRRRQHT